MLAGRKSEERTKADRLSLAFWGRRFCENQLCLGPREGAELSQIKMLIR
jgi:hypothetical protein